MRGARKLVVVAVALALAGCFWREPKPPKYQRRSKLDLRPVAISIDDPYRGPVRTAQVRVLANAAYRSQVPGWRRRFAQQISAANPPLVEALGLRLEVLEYRDWDYPDDEDVHAALDALTADEPGRDVEWVIGLIGSLPRAGKSHHELGSARVLGRHMVLRALHSLSEIRHIGKGMSSKVYEQRLHHKEQAILLHELAHTLGAPHETGEELLMSPSYSHVAGTFSAEGLDLIRAVLAERLALPEGDRARRIRKALAAQLAGWSADRLNGEERTTLEQLSSEPAATGGDEIEPAPLPTRLRPVDRQAFAEATRKLNGGDAEGAFEAAAELFELHADDPQVTRLECAIRGRRPRARDAAVPACRRAAEIAPDDPEPALLLAEVSVGIGKAEGAAALAVARARLQARGAQADRKHWARLAALYRQMEAPTPAAQAAAAAGPDGETVAAWAQQIRARFAVPEGLPPERESDYVVEMHRLMSGIDARKPELTERAVAAARKQLGALPGFALVLCDLDARRGRYDAAEAHCKRVLAAQPGASWAHYLLGALAARTSAHARAGRHLRAAIAADPELEQAYVTLGQVLQAQPDPAGLAQLQLDYQKQFKRTLR